MTFKSFKLIIIVILVLIILFFTINNKKEHLINNSEVQKSFQTLAQLLANNQLTVKPVNTNTDIDIDRILQNIAVNADESGRIRGYLPSNILYDNGKFRDVNNRFIINPDGTFSSTDFVFQEGLIKNTNNTVLYDPNTKKLKYNKVTYDGVTNKLEENNKKYLINQEGDIKAEEINYLYNNNTFTTPFVSYDINTKVLKQKDNKFTIDNIGNLNAGDIIYEERTGNVTVKDLIYNKNTDRISKGSQFVYDADKNLTLNNGDLLYTVDGTIKKNNNRYQINKDGIITAENFKFENEKVTVGNLDYDVTKQNEIVFGEDIMYDFNDKVIKKLDDSVIIEQYGKIKARKNNDDYDFIYDTTGDITARDLVYAENGDITARDLVYRPDNEITARNDFVYKPSGEISARGLVYKPDKEISARDFVYKSDNEISARDFVYSPNGDIIAKDILYQNNIVKNRDNIFEYNTTTKAFNADYLGKNANGTNKYNFNMDNTGDVKAYPNATNTAYDVKYDKQDDTIEIKDIIYDKKSNIFIKAGPNYILYDINNNIFKALQDSSDNFNFVMDKGVIQAQYNNVTKKYYFNLNGKNIDIKPNADVKNDISIDTTNNIVRALAGDSSDYNFVMDKGTINANWDPISKTYLMQINGNAIKIKDLLYENSLLSNQSKTIKYNIINNTLDITGPDNTITRYMIDNNTGDYISTVKLLDVSNNKLVDATYKFNKYGTLIDSPNFYNEIIIMKKAEDVTKSGALHIRKIFMYDINGYTAKESTSTTTSTGTILTLNDIDELVGENMNHASIGSNVNYGALNQNNLLVDGSTPYFSGHGIAAVNGVNVNQAIRIRFKKSRRLASIRIDNRLDCCQRNIHGTVIYFRKNGNSLAKIDILAPTNANGINITTATTIDNFPLQKYNVDMFKNRGYTAPLHQPFLNNQQQWLSHAGSSMWRFFGAGYVNTTLNNTGGNWTSTTNYPFRPWIALLVPTIAGTLDQRDDYK
jgi:hypothetical protein